MTDRLAFRDGCVVVGCPVDPLALSELRSRIPRAARFYDPRRRELLVAEPWGLEAIAVLESFGADTIGGAR